MQVVFMKETTNMKKLNLSLAILALAAMSVNAETVTSGIVGYQTKTISTGLNSLGLPLLKPDLLKTAVTSVTGVAVLLSGETNFGAKLNAAKSYYIEVYGGTSKGDRFDVDVTATIAAANGTVVLNASSANNTMPTSSIGTALNNETVAVREHILLADLDSYLSTPAVGNNSISLSDGVGFTESGSLIFYNKKADGTWKKVGNSADFSAKIIPAGVGVFIKKYGTAVTLTQVGNVRENDFARPLTTQLSLVAPAFPVDLTPANLAIVPGSGATDWTGGTVVTGDYVSKVESGSLIKYTLKTDGSINKVGNSTDFKNTALFVGSEAQLVKRTKANADLVEVKPF